MSTNPVATPGAGLEGVVAGESEICYIDGYAGVLSYRGYNIHTLAEHATFEETIWLLWEVTLPKEAELNQLKATKLMAQTSTIVSSFGRLRSGECVVAPDKSLSFAGNFLYCLTGKKP